MTIANPKDQAVATAAPAQRRRTARSAAGEEASGRGGADSARVFARARFRLNGAEYGTGKDWSR